MAEFKPGQKFTVGFELANTGNIGATARIGTTVEVDGVQVESYDYYDVFVPAGQGMSVAKEFLLPIDAKIGRANLWITIRNPANLNEIYWEGRTAAYFDIVAVPVVDFSVSNVVVY